MIDNQWGITVEAVDHKAGGGKPEEAFADLVKETQRDDKINALKLASQNNSLNSSV